MSALRHLLPRGLLAGWLVLWALGAQAAPAVLVLLSDDSGAYLEVAETMRADLHDRGVGMQTLVAGDVQLDDKARRVGAEMVVAVGVRATQAAGSMRPGVPVLSVLVPRAAAERLRGEFGNRFGAIYLDQPHERQLHLVRLLLPGKSRIGAIFGPESEGQQSALREVSRQKGYKLVTTVVTQASELAGALNRVLSETDLLLAIADPLVFGPGTAQTVLLASYRHLDPVIAFSPAYVRAGALAAVYSTPAQLGKQAAELVERVVVRRGSLPDYQHPRHFSVSVNYKVARSMGLDPPAETVLAESLLRAEQ